MLLATHVQWGKNRKEKVLNYQLSALLTKDSEIGESRMGLSIFIA